MKRLALIGMVLMMTLMLTTGVMAAAKGNVGAKFVRPQSSNATGLSGDYKLVVAVWNTSQEQWNVSFWYKATGATSWTHLYSNKTENLTTYNYTFNPADLGLKDELTYVFNVTIFNGTGSNFTVDTARTPIGLGNTTTNVIIDHTKPICSITTPSANTGYSNELTVTITATNATNCSIWINQEEFKVWSNGSDGAEVCTKTFTTSELPEGQYDVDAISKDRQNSTSCTTVKSVRLENQLSGVRGRVIDEEEGLVDTYYTSGSSSDGQGNSKALLVALLAIGGVWWWQKKK